MVVILQPSKKVIDGFIPLVEQEKQMFRYWLLNFFSLSLSLSLDN